MDVQKPVKSQPCGRNADVPYGERVGVIARRSSLPENPQPSQLQQAPSQQQQRPRTRGELMERRKLQLAQPYVPPKQLSRCQEDRDDYLNSLSALELEQQQKGCEQHDQQQRQRQAAITRMQPSPAQQPLSTPSPHRYFEALTLEEQRQQYEQFYLQEQQQRRQQRPSTSSSVHQSSLPPPPPPPPQPQHHQHGQPYQPLEQQSQMSPSSTSAAAFHAALNAAKVSLLRSEIAALEREAENISMSRSRTAQVKRLLALNRSELHRLTTCS